MRLYVAGPMSNIQDLNYPAFAAESTRLRALGHVVVNPAEVNAGIEHEGWEACMRRDIAVLMTCDGVQMLAGWKASRGARIEHGLAESVGLWIFYPEVPFNVAAV